MKSTKAIRKELAILIKSKKKACTTKKEENVAVNDARQEINAKYGKGWREQEITKETYQEPSVYDGHENGEYWMD